MLDYTKKDPVPFVATNAYYELLFPGDSEAFIRLWASLDIASVRRYKERTIAITASSFTSIPAFSQIRKASKYTWELEMTCLQYDALRMEDKLTAADDLLSQETQQYLVLYDHVTYVNVTEQPQYAGSVITPEHNVVFEGFTYSFCAFNVFVESLELPSTATNMNTRVPISLIIKEV